MVTSELFQPASKIELRGRGYSWFKRINICVGVAQKGTRHAFDYSTMDEVGCQARMLQCGPVCVGWFIGKKRSFKLCWTL